MIGLSGIIPWETALHHWLLRYPFNCDVQIREAYATGINLLWVCYPNWVNVLFIFGVVFIVGLIGILLEILRQKEDIKNAKSGPFPAS